MGLHIKEELQKLYEAPKPARKREFFRNLDRPPLKMHDLLYIQMSYIPKWEWALSAVLLFWVGFMSAIAKMEILVFSIVLMMMPFLAVTAVSEGMRSVTYGMHELEMAARLSLKVIVLARMGIVGTANMLFAFAAAYFMQGKFVQTVLLLLVPYLITAYGSLFIVRAIAGKEGIYACMGLSGIVGSLSVSVYSRQYAWICQERFMVFWLAAVALLVYMVFKEGRKTASKVMHACF